MDSYNIYVTNYTYNYRFSGYKIDAVSQRQSLCEVRSDGRVCRTHTHAYANTRKVYRVRSDRNHRPKGLLSPVPFRGKPQCGYTGVSMYVIDLCTSVRKQKLTTGCHCESVRYGRGAFNPFGKGSFISTSQYPLGKLVCC